MAHAILFEHGQFHGAHKHFFAPYDNLNANDDSGFNDVASSIIVLEGNWEFFEDSGFQHKTGKTLGPGLYPDLNQVDIRNDAISSLRPV